MAQKLPQIARIVRQRDERILLSDLLHHALAEVMPAACARNITLSAHRLSDDLPAIYGSSHWLSKAMSE